MTMVFRTLFGSHLYGTATPSSDVDWKEVFIPPAREILLGTVRDSHQAGSKENDRSGFQKKNQPGDTDTERHSLRKFLLLAAQGQTIAVDMLFATPLVLAGNLEGYTSATWREIWANRDRIASRQCRSFIGYCYQQASKYGLKGSRVAAAEATVLFLEQAIEAHGHLAKMRECDFSELATIEHIELIDIETPSGERLRHLSVCNRKCPFTVTLKEALAIYRKLYDNYGHRAQQAKNNENVDWKACSHAVRIGNQAIEYLSTGFVTFPNPNRDRLLAIKCGERPYAEVAAEIEGLLVEVENAATRSTLPDLPDFAWIDDFVVEVYKREIVAS